MKRLTIAATLLALSFIAISCDDNAPSQPQSISTPAQLRIAPRDDRSFMVMWDAPARGTEGYVLEWTTTSGTTGRMELAPDRRMAVIALGDGDIDIRARLSTADGAELATGVAESLIDRLMPPPPRALEVHQTDEFTMQASWQPSTDANVTGYLVFWSNGMADGTGLRIVDRSTTSIVVDPIRLDTFARLSVSAMRGASMSRFVSGVAGSFDGVETPQAIRVASVSSTSVRVMWDAVEFADSYQLSWIDASGTVASMTTQEIEATATGLAAGVVYTFQVAARRGSAMSEPAAIAWAPATRLLTDVSTNASIRMYESSSSFPSSIIIDPSLGGPKAVSLLPQGSGKGQLAMYVTPTTGGPVDELIVGPLNAIPELRAAVDPSRVDQNVYISSNTVSANNLDDWLLQGPIDDVFGPYGNISAFSFSNVFIGGQGFFVRTGTPGNYHYARVLLRPDGSSLLHGTAPNRYVVLEISYQSAANVPYAKVSSAPIGVRATRMR